MEDQWVSELLSLLEDEPFCVVSQQGLVSSTEYKVVIKCLGDFCAPVEAYPMKDMSALMVAQIFVHELVCRMGIPDVMHNDQGRNFESAVVDLRFIGDKENMDHTYPQSDGMLEHY